MSDARNETIKLFEKGIFPYKDNTFKESEKESEEESDHNLNHIYDLFKDYFDLVVYNALAKKII